LEQHWNHIEITNPKPGQQLGPPPPLQNMKITIPKNHHILKKATLNLVGRFSHISTFAQNLIDQPEV
jgi:hypothetical protein